MGVEPGGTGITAGGEALLIYDKDVGNGLGEGSIDGRSVHHAVFKVIGYRDRASFDTLPAARTLVLQDVPGLAADLHVKIAYIPRNLLHLAVGEELDVFMLAHGDHLGSEDTGGAVQSGKGFVKLGHVAPYAGFPLHQVDGTSGIGDV